MRFDAGREQTALIQIPARSLVVWTGLVAGLLMGCQPGITWGAPPDVRARTAIFGDDVLASNVAIIRAGAAELPAEARYDWLLKQILPSSSHDSIRFAADFVTTSDADSAALYSGDNTPRGRIVSPVTDLVETARQLNRLSDLRQRIQACDVEGEIPQRHRIALLALVALAAGNTTDADALLLQLDARLANETFPQLADRWPETLLLAAAVEHPALRDVASGIIERILANQIRASKHSGPPAWDQHIASFLGRARYLQLAERTAAADTTEPPQPFHAFPPLQSWKPVDNVTAITHGNGFPGTHWHLAGQEVHKLASHHDSLLMFASPLSGNYQIECDLSGFGHREGQLMVHGQWLWLYYTHQMFELGTLNGAARRIPIEPRLSLVNDDVHYRCTVRDGVCRHFINGRLLHTSQPRATPFPWPAIRSPYWAATSVRDVRITGEPTVLSTVRLSDDPELRAWTVWDGDLDSEQERWQFAAEPGTSGEITAVRSATAAGTHREHLLRCFRPMLEDGVIEYEFYFEPDQFLVSPAFGDLTFVLSPQGVRIHQLTDGRWERSELDPANQSEPIESPGYSLRSGWNQMRMQLAGDLLTLQLNRQQVYHDRVDSHSDRTFGLFHDLGEASVRVRNVTWTGDWPRELPSLRDQELRSTTLDEMEAHVAGLKEHVAYDFVRERPRAEKIPNSLPFSTQQFLTQVNDPGAKLLVRTDGVFMQRDVGVPFQDVWIGRRFQVHGDFDIVAEFADLRVGTPYDGHRRIALTVVTDDERITHCRVWHGIYAHPGIDRRHCTQAEFTRFFDGEVAVEIVSPTAEDSDSGRLRFVRIGKEFFYLIAEADSPGYRLI
ncbi:MAG: DUF1583 domain-containing protein, partial [Planctomycetaceae bacterium]|nr:DUF1583 domain-containing protein [Planctomycetaceae bacterium]